MDYFLSEARFCKSQLVQSRLGLHYLVLSALDGLRPATALLSTQKTENTLKRNMLTLSHTFAAQIAYKMCFELHVTIIDK